MPSKYPGVVLIQETADLYMSIPSVLPNPYYLEDAIVMTRTTIILGIIPYSCPLTIDVVAT